MTTLSRNPEHPRASASPTPAGLAILRRAEPGDRPAVIRLLEAANLPTDGLDSDLAGFLVALEEDRVVGVAGLEQYAEFGLLRSVAVSDERRGQGLGARLTSAIVEEARGRSLAGLYALTTTASGYFPRLGFEVVERDAVPVPVRGSAEFASICPASATALALRLDSA